MSRWRDGNGRELFELASLPSAHQTFNKFLLRRMAEKIAGNAVWQARQGKKPSIMQAKNPGAHWRTSKKCWRNASKQHWSRQKPSQRQVQKPLVERNQRKRSANRQHWSKQKSSQRQLQKNRSRKETRETRCGKKKKSAAQDHSERKNGKEAVHAPAKKTQQAKQTVKTGKKPEDLTSAEMRKILAARNQSVTGLRPELLARLLASEKVDMQWHRNETVAAKMATPKFCGKKPGPVGVAHGRQVLYYFLLMFPLTLFKFLALETNRYGNENCAKKKRSWKETSITELVHWVGILILMGMHVLPARADYWDVDGFLHNSEIIATMTLGRFRNLCVFFHAYI